ncbi:MAG: PilZ domain-containing protein [Burkholderiaceae bacterium]
MESPFGGIDLLVNQRTAQRIVFYRKVHLVGADGNPIPIKTFDISETGIGLMRPHPVDARQVCVLNILTLYNAVPELALKGLVAYCMLSGTQGYRVGLQYTDTPPQVKSLIRHISANVF